MTKIITYEALTNGVVVDAEVDGHERPYVIEKAVILELFHRYGGGFVTALGVALGRADDNNTLKILTTWDQLVKEYLAKFHNFYSKVMTDTESELVKESLKLAENTIGCDCMFYSFENYGVVFEYPQNVTGDSLYIYVDIDRKLIERNYIPKF